MLWCAPIIVPTAVLPASDRLLYQARRVALLQIKSQLSSENSRDPLICDLLNIYAPVSAILLIISQVLCDVRVEGVTGISSPLVKFTPC